MQWRCMVCGYVHEGGSPPEECPVCGAPFAAFQRESPAESETLPTVATRRRSGYRYVIIGNSSAGRSAAHAIRRLDPEAGITLLSEETVPFYYRPILPDFIGGMSEARVFRAAKGAYGDDGLEILSGETVVSVDAAAKLVRCSSGRDVPFDSLLIASGSSPIMIPWPGSDTRGIACFRTFADAQGIAELAADARHAIVVGGGLLGLEFVRAFLARDLPVTLLVRGNRIGAPGLDEEAGAIIERRLRELGVTVALDEEVVSLESRNGRVCQVNTSRNRSLPCDLLGVAVGVRPCISFLVDSGLHCDRGILVNDRLETNVPGIFAAGDVAQGHDLAYGIARVNTSWRTAKDLGEIAGFNMASAEVRYPGTVGSNFQIFGGVSFASIGLTQPTEDSLRVVKACEPDQGQYQKLVYRGDQLVGAVLVGDTGRASELEQQIRGALRPVSTPEKKVKGETNMHKMTEENLKAAFAGESQAHMKYLAFSEKAQKEGKTNVARLFAAASLAEQGHATSHLRTLKGIGSTAENLDVAFGGEDFELTEMYPAYIAVAEAQSESGAKRSFDRALEAEKIHRALYRKAKEAVEADSDVELGAIWVCEACGWTGEGDEPDECPLCGAPKERIRKF